VDGRYPMKYEYYNYGNMVTKTSYTSYSLESRNITQWQKFDDECQPDTVCWIVIVKSILQSVLPKIVCIR